MNPTGTRNDFRPRHVLRDVAACALAAGLLTIAGCASQPAEPPKPISLLAVLPVWAPPSESNAGFGSQPVLVVPIVVPSGSQGGISTGGAVAAGVITSAVIYNIQESNRRGREALAEALSHVNFDAAAEIDSRLAPALEQRQVRLVRITDPGIIWGVRAGKFDGLPAGVDAVLDVRITESGYYSSTRAGGYSPMLLVTATLLPPVTNADVLDEFSYYADWRTRETDKRWITTPSSMTFSTVELLKAGAGDARAGLARVVDQMVPLMVQDLERHAKGELRVD